MTKHLNNIEYEDHRGSYLKCTHSKQSHNVTKWLLHLLLALLPTGYECYNQFRKKLNAHPPHPCIKNTRDERADEILSDPEYPYCEIARVPNRAALTA